MKKRIKILKYISFILFALWFIPTSIGMYYIVGRSYNSAEGVAHILGLALGTFCAPLVAIGFTIIFWTSYKLKYPNEELLENIFRKIVASLLVLFISSLFIDGYSMLIFFMITTIVLFIRNYEKSIII